MNASPRLDRIFSFTSWIIAVVLLYAAAQVWVLPPSGNGPVASAIGVFGAQIFYSVAYAVAAITLALSKMLKKKTLRKHTLMIIYLVGFGTSLLTFMSTGWSPKLIDNIVLSGTAAFCWLYWKFKTEYINSDDFGDDIWVLRNDTPGRNY